MNKIPCCLPICFNQQVNNLTFLTIVSNAPFLLQGSTMVTNEGKRPTVGVILRLITDEVSFVKQINGL